MSSHIPGMNVLQTSVLSKGLKGLEQRMAIVLCMSFHISERSLLKTSIVVSQRSGQSMSRCILTYALASCQIKQEAEPALSDKVYTEGNLIEADVDMRSWVLVDATTRRSGLLSAHKRTLTQANELGIRRRQSPANAHAVVKRPVKRWRARYQRSIPCSRRFCWLWRTCCISMLIVYKTTGLILQIVGTHGLSPSSHTVRLHKGSAHKEIHQCGDADRPGALHNKRCICKW